MSRLLRDGWQVVIGIETHAQIKTRQKLFSAAQTSLLSHSANTRFNAFDAAFPGTLPKLNDACVSLAIRAAIALNCTIHRTSSFDRKHYFYPDLPSGYQITQRYAPFASEGKLLLPGFDKHVRIQQVQLEQDTAKSIFNRRQLTSHIDLNRAGIGLLEIVTEPDLSSPEEAVDYVRTLQNTLRAVGVSDGNMDAGSFRCDVNVSVNQVGQPAGTRCEIKNLNSLKFIAAAINHEITRHQQILSTGASVPQETRAFDQDRFETVKLRSKEDAPDYRYMPDPNLGTLHISPDRVEAVRANMPLLPHELRDHLLKTYSPAGVTTNDIDVLLNLESTKEIGYDGEDSLNGSVAYFENLCVGGRNPKTVMNWIVHTLKGFLDDDRASYPSVQVMGELIDLVEQKVVTQPSGKLLLRELLRQPPAPPGSPSTVKDLATKMELISFDTTSSTGEGGFDLTKLCQDVIVQCPAEVAAIQGGNINVANKLIGRVLKETRGRANAQVVRKTLLELLDATS